jgi:competence protein ComEC
VLQIESAGGRVLLTGDIEARAEAEMLERAPAMRSSDVVVVPHHGSRTSSTSAFIAAVAPSIAVFAAGYRNRFGHPRPDVVARYLHAGVARLRTDLQGAIDVLLEAGQPVSATAERETHRRYWYDVPID